MRGDLIVAVLNSSKDFGSMITNYLEMNLHPLEDKKFPDGESYVRFLEDVRGKDLFIIQSLYDDPEEDVDKKLMKLAIAIKGASGSSAGRITVVIPYLAYSRQDRKDKSRAPLTAQLVADILEASFATTEFRILSMLWHSTAIQNAYRFPVDILRPTKLLAEYYFNKFKDDMPVVISPDRKEGIAKELKNMLSKLYNHPIRMAYGGKNRISDDGTETVYIVGEEEIKDKNVIICDDEISTGGTLIDMAEKAKDKGAKNVYACVVHAKLVGNAIEKINNSSLKEVLITNTIFRSDKFFQENPKFKLISVHELFGEAIKRIHNEESLSKLFE